MKMACEKRHQRSATWRGDGRGKNRVLVFCCACAFRTAVAFSCGLCAIAALRSHNSVSWQVGRGVANGVWHNSMAIKMDISNMWRAARALMTLLRYRWT